MLYIDLRPGQTCHSKDGGSAYSIGVGELGWQNGTGLKSHGTVTNWCTGRGWSVNCMTVISARWRLKHAIPKEWALNCYITECTGNSISLERRCGRESQHPAEGASGPPIEQFGDRRVWRPDQLETRCGRENQHPERLVPRASGWATLESGKETLMAIRVGVNMLQFCSVSNSLSHATLSNKVRGIFFSELCRSSSLCRCVYVFICIIWVYNINSINWMRHKNELRFFRF